MVPAVHLEGMFVVPRPALRLHEDGHVVSDFPVGVEHSPFDELFLKLEDLLRGVSHLRSPPDLFGELLDGPAQHRPFSTESLFGFEMVLRVGVFVCPGFNNVECFL